MLKNIKENKFIFCMTFLFTLMLPISNYIVSKFYVLKSCTIIKGIISEFLSANFQHYFFNTLMFIILCLYIQKNISKSIIGKIYIISIINPIIINSLEYIFNPNKITIGFSGICYWISVK